MAAPFLSLRQHFPVVGSTNDVVRDWLAEGTPEVCLAVADEQTAGRGRDGRSWQAPRGAALLFSLGFRPRWIPPDRVWRVAAVVSVAMAEAADEVAGLPNGTIRLKWPNDLVVDDRAGGWRKLAGVLGETAGLGSHDPRLVIGIGLNADWPAAQFPPELREEMTSLAEIAGRSVDRARVLDAFLARLEPVVGALREGRFDGPSWAARQSTTGRLVELQGAAGDLEVATALGVDEDGGGLRLADPGRPGAERVVIVGEVRHLRLASPARAGV